MKTTVKVLFVGLVIVLVYLGVFQWNRSLCEKLYSRARTHADSLVVDAARPVDGMPFPCMAVGR